MMRHLVPFAVLLLALVAGCGSQEQAYRNALEIATMGESRLETMRRERDEDNARLAHRRAKMIEIEATTDRIIRLSPESRDEELELLERLRGEQADVEQEIAARNHAERVRAQEEVVKQAQPKVERLRP